MTDNRTTELLPCPWCGVDMKLHAINYPWADGDPSWSIWHEDMGEAARRKCPMEMGGYDTREEAIEAWNTRAHGTLTAEQVSKAVYAHSIHADCADADWQAIADELNAELGSETCKFVSSKGSDYPPVCSACGYELGIYDCEWLEGGTYDYDGNYCPNCGCKVVSA